MNNDESRRKVLADKYPEMEQRFQEIKQDPPIEHLGQTVKEQKQRTQK